MRFLLSLALYSDHLSLFMSEADSRGGWGAALRALLRRGASQRQPTNASIGASTQLSVEFAPEKLSIALEQAWSTATTKHPQAVKNADLSVHLGLAHARLGLLPLVEEGGPHLTKEAIDSYVQAWVGQMWSLDPATQVIRWEVTDAGDHALISCINRDVYRELESFAHRHDLRFFSCTPAVLSAMRLAAPPSRRGSSAAKQSGESVITVWSEPTSTGQRASLVQLIHHIGSKPQALWRGWLPAQESSSAPEDALQGALRRFMVACKLPASTGVEWVHWRYQPSVPARSGVAT